MNSMSYRKRELAHWNEGKRYKGVRKARERSYVKKYIELQIDELDDNFKYRHYSHKSNLVAKAEYWVNWSEQVIRDHEGRKEGSAGSHLLHYFRTALSRAKKKLRDLKNVRVQSK